MELLRLAGVGLNIVGVGVWFWIVRYILEASHSFPPLRHGRLEISGKGMGVAWAVLLLGALAVGGPMIARADHSTLPASVSVDRPDFFEVSDLLRMPHPLNEQIVGGRGHTIRFGAYGRAYHSWELQSGESVSYSIVEFRLPIYFPLALVLFWLGAVRRRVTEIDEGRFVLP